MKHFTSTAVQDGAWRAVQSDQESGERSKKSPTKPTIEDLRDALSIATDLNGTEINALVGLPPRRRFLRRFKR